jgi:hypothetical protein
VSNRKPRNRTDRKSPQAETTVKATQETIQDPRSILEIGVAWLRANTVWALGLTPFALAALQLLIVARGDPATLRVLVQNADPIRVMLGSVLPVIPMALLILPPYYLERRIRGESIPPWWGGASIAITALGLFTLPSSWFGYLTTLYLMLTFVAYEEFLRRRGSKSVRVYNPVVSFGTVLILVAGAAGPWVSAEVVEQRNDGPIVAYFVDDREGWVTLLRYGDGIKIMHSADVTNRTACNVRIPGRSMIGWLFDWPEGNPLCKDQIDKVNRRGSNPATPLPKPAPQPAPQINAPHP